MEFQCQSFFLNNADVDALYYPEIYLSEFPRRTFLWSCYHSLYHFKISNICMLMKNEFRWLHSKTSGFSNITSKWQLCYIFLSRNVMEILTNYPHHPDDWRLILEAVRPPIRMQWKFDPRTVSPCHSSSSIRLVHRGFVQDIFKSGFFRWTNSHTNVTVCPSSSYLDW